MENSTQIAAAEAPEPADSTVITEAPAVEPNQHKALSRDDAINKALDEMGAEDDEPEAPVKTEKAEEKPAGKEPEVKPEKDAKEADEKPEKEEKPDPAPEAKKEQPEQDKQPRKLPEAPKDFLPRAKEVWRNTPREVQAEVERMVRDHAAREDELRERSERYETVRDFDELARQNGRDLRQSLMAVHEIENLAKQNPIAALQRVLIDAGPRKADGTPLSLMEVAQFVVQAGPEAYQRAMQAPVPQAQQQANAEVEALKSQLAQLQQQQVLSSVIEPFRAANPRYDELEHHIAAFLKSDMIPKSLSLPDKLAAAYDMAERINPPSHAASESEASPAISPTRRADDDFSGSRSIKGSPGAGIDRSKPSRKVSKDEAISLAMAEIFGTQG